MSRIVMVNVESDCIRAIVVKGSKVVRWASGPIEHGLVKDGVITNVVRMGETIDAFFREKKLPRGRVEVGVTGLRSVNRILTLPKLKPSMLMDAIQNEAEREMPVPTKELYLSWQKLPGKSRTETHFFVLGVPRNVVDSQIASFRRAGIRPQVMALKPMALTRAVNLSEAVVVNMEAGICEVFVVADGMPVIMRTLILSGKQLTVTDKVRQMTNELHRVIDFYNNSRPNQPLGQNTPVFLTGGLANDDTIRYLVSTSTRHPVRSIPSSLVFPSILPISEYAVNLGMAFKGSPSKYSPKRGNADFSIVGMNILPVEMRPNRINTKKILYPMAAVISIALLISSYLSVVAGGAEMKRLDAQLSHFEQQLQKAKEATAAINKVEAEAGKLESERYSMLKPTGFSQSLRKITTSVSDEIMLASISQAESQIQISGSARTHESILAYVVALQSSGALVNPSVSLTEGNTKENPIAFKITAAR